MKNYSKPSLKAPLLFIFMYVLVFFFTQEIQAQTSSEGIEFITTNLQDGRSIRAWISNVCGLSRRNAYEGPPFYPPHPTAPDYSYFRSHYAYKRLGLDWEDGRASFTPPTGHDYFLSCHDGASYGNVAQYFVYLGSSYSNLGLSRLPPGEYIFTYYVATLPPKNWSKEDIERWTGKKVEEFNTKNRLKHVPFGSVDHYRIRFHEDNDHFKDKYDLIKLPSKEWTKQTYKFTVKGGTNFQGIEIIVGDPSLIWWGSGTRWRPNPEYDSSVRRIFHLSVPENAIKRISSSSPLCRAGTDFPSLNKTTITSKCPTEDLTAIKVTNKPEGTSLTWHTATPPTDANKITGSIKAVTPGTYYAAFYDAENKCYGNATAVTITTTTNVGTEGPRW